MIFATLLACVAVCGGTLATYLYDEGAHPAARLAAGLATGLAALGLSGFIFASLIGFGAASLALSGLIVALPLALLARRDLRARLRFDAGRLARDLRDGVTRPTLRTTAPLLLTSLSLVLFWIVFGRAMFERAGEIYTGVDNNLGDLPFHLSIIESFVRGGNFPPTHPEYAGARLTYPFVVDFVAAMFTRAGAGVESALFFENVLLALSLVGLLYRFALEWTRDRLAALLAPLLIIFSGGLGFVRLYLEASASKLGFTDFLARLPHDYTITFDGSFRWGNAVTTLFVPQRGLLMGLPIALVVMTQWWLAIRSDETDKGAVGEFDVGTRARFDAQARGRADAEIKGRKSKKSKKGSRANARAKGGARESVAPPTLAPFKSLPFVSKLDGVELRMLGAGLVAGMLPLVHAHTFVSLMLVGGCLALLFPRWRAWIIFFAAAFIVAAPAMWWATRGTAARASSFFAWQLGWDRGTQNPVWFWFKNMGLFIPLLVAALAWRGRDPLVSKRALIFYLPFTLLFLVCNAGKISPWVWDNIKVLFYWFVASAPLVALLLARLWRMNLATRIASVALICVLTLAGALDVWRVVSEASEQREFDRDGVAFASTVERETAPRSLILHAPTYNHPVYLSGRQSLMGYAGHLWSQGIDYAARDAEIRRIYAGAPDAESLLAREHVEYVVISPLERTSLTVNEQFFTRYKKVGETGAYRLYKITSP
ncbi:MAG: hypothetical protein QOE33_920 [Acidobacteriota bacterium]|nr:hypothetical protein [Acidobacteriota bacterium]